MRRGWLALGKLEERKTQGEIQKMKHKSNFTNEIYISPWSEIVGIYFGLIIDECFTQVKIGNNAVSFPKDSDEEKYLRNRLNNSLIGSKIGILKTDMSDKPILVRRITYNLPNQKLSQVGFR